MSDVTVGSCLFKAAMSGVGVSLKEHTITVVGSVTEDPNTVHFVVRSVIGLAAQTTSRMDVVTVVHEGGAWRVKLPQNLTARGGAAATASAQRPGGQPAPPPLPRR